MIDDKDTNVVYFSDLLRTNVKFTTTYKQLTSILNSHNITYKFLPETKDIWVRDYMPIQINRNSFLEYRYDPNYLQGDKKDSEI